MDSSCWYPRCSPAPLCRRPASGRRLRVAQGGPSGTCATASGSLGPDGLTGPEQRKSPAGCSLTAGIDKRRVRRSCSAWGPTLTASIASTMSWTDFDADTLLERDMLLRALPLAETISTGSSRATVDLAADTVATAVAANETVGPTPAGCVDLLGIRPPLAGAAWKVLDLLLEATRPGRSDSGSEARLEHREEALACPHANVEASGLSSCRMGRIDGDVRRDGRLTPQPRAPDGLHRSVARTGRRERIRSPTAAAGPQEQEALGRSVLGAADLVVAPVPDARVEADLTRQLGLLHSLHHVTLRAVTVQESLPEITVIVDADPTVPGNTCSTCRHFGPGSRFRVQCMPTWSCGFATIRGRSSAGGLRMHHTRSCPWTLSRPHPG